MATNLHDKLWEQQHGKPSASTQYNDLLREQLQRRTMPATLKNTFPKPATAAPAAAPMSPVPKPPTPPTQGGNSTLALQQKLKAAGYDPGPLDGIMGSRTQAAQDAYNNRAPVAPLVNKVQAPPAGVTPPAAGVSPASTGTPLFPRPGDNLVNGGTPPAADVAPQYTPDTAYQEAMAQLQAQMQQLQSPEYFQQTLQQIMSSYQPLIDANTQGINTQFDEYSRQTDVDADRRGMFMSGAAGENQRKLGESEASEVNRMKAEIQGQAAGQAQTSVQNQLQAAVSMGELGSKYAGLSQDDRQFASTLDMNYAQINQDDRQFLEEMGFKKDMHADDMKNFSDDMQFKYYGLDQDQQQFVEEMGFKKASLVSSENIAKMGFASSRASAAADNEIALAKLKLEQDRYGDEKTYNASQASLQMLQVEQEAFGFLNSDLMSVKNGANWAELKPKYDIYKDTNTYGDLYTRITEVAGTTAREMVADVAKKTKNKGVVSEGLEKLLQQSGYYNK